MKKKFIDIALNAALKAGRYAKSRKNFKKKVEYKGAANIVTDVDKTSEEIIVTAIRKAYKGHGILSEENYSKNEEHEYKWVIDPIDGTTNYYRSLPIYSVSIGLEHNGKPIAGVVYDPEREEIYTAESGEGAYLNKKRIHVSKVSKMKSAFLVTGFAYNLREAKNSNIRHFTRFLKSSLAIRRLGSASIDLCYVACGRFDGYWEMNLKPWDSCAGYLIVNEAGGKITRFNGSRYTIYDNEILATNNLIHQNMIRILSK